MAEAEIVRFEEHAYNESGEAAPAFEDHCDRCSGTDQGGAVRR